MPAADHGERSASGRVGAPPAPRSFPALPGVARSRTDAGRLRSATPGGDHPGSGREAAARLRGGRPGGRAVTKASGWSVITRHSYHAEVERQEFPREAEAVTAWHVARGLKDFRAGGFVLLVKDGKLIRGRALG